MIFCEKKKYLKINRLGCIVIFYENKINHRMEYMMQIF